MSKLFLPGYVFQHRGAPVARGGVKFTSTGGNTLKSIFTDTALSSAATNSETTTPQGQPLDAEGKFEQGDLYGSGDYRVTLYDAAGGQIYVRDDYTPDAVIDEGLDTQWSYNQTADIITGKIDGTDAVKFGRQDVADTGFLTLDAKAYTADTTENTHGVALLSTNSVTIPAGTTALATQLYITEPNITATGTVTNAVSLYIKDAPTEGGTGNFALWVDDGAVKFDSTLEVTGTSTMAAITASADVTGTNFIATGDTAAADPANIGQTDSEGLILTGQGSATDVTIKNDADETVLSIPTGTTGMVLLNTGTENGLLIDQDGNGIGLSIDSEATSANAISIDGTQTVGALASFTANSLTDGSVIALTSSSTDTSSRELVNVQQTSPLATGATALFVRQDSTAKGVFIDQNDNGTSLFIDSESTTVPVMHFSGPASTSGHILHVDAANSLTTGSAIRVNSDGSDTGTRNLIEVVNDNSAATGATCLAVTQDSTADGIFINQNGNGIALNIDSEATSVNVIAINADPLTSGDVFAVTADGLTTGGIISAISDSSDTGTRVLVDIVNDNTAAVNVTPLNIQQDAVTETNFKILMDIAGFTIFTSDGTTAEGALTGVVGDLCLNGGTGNGQLAYCDNTGTNWTDM